MLVSRTGALRDLYARLLIERLDADPDRIADLDAACRTELAHCHGADAQEAREVWQCVLDLCGRAANMVRDAGAVDDPLARQRLLAAVKHQNTVDILGAVPGVAEQSAAGPPSA